VPKRIEDLDATIHFLLKTGANSLFWPFAGPDWL